MEFETILQESCGGFGRFQKEFAFLFMVPVALFLPWFWLSLVLSLSVPEHRCLVPGLENKNLSEGFIRSVVLRNTSCSGPPQNFFGNFSGDVLNVTEVPLEDCTTGWKYSTDTYDETVVTEWNLVCNNRYYPSLILTLQNVGSLLGTSAYGYLSDKHGRRSIFFGLALLVVATETITVLYRQLVPFIILRTINGSILPAMFSLPFILGIELAPPEYRAQMTGAINIAWTVGLSIQPIIAYLTRHWVAMAIANAAAALFIMSYWKFLPESPCWLISESRYEEAVDVLKKIGDKNGANPDRTLLLKKLQALGADMNRKKSEETFSKFNLLKYPRLRKHFILLTLGWVANSAAYSGLLYNVRNLSGNEFLNYFLLAIVEVPGNVAFMILMDRIGRRWSSVGGFLLSGVICLVPATGLPYSDIISSMAGKFLVSGNYMVTDQQASEIFPTVTRTFGIGASKTIATAVTLFLPYIADLNVYGKEVPFLVIAALCFFTGVCASFLPETLNENLPQTTTEAENFGKDQKFLSWRRKKDPSKKDGVVVHESCHI